MRDFLKLDVWRESHAFTINVYRLTTDFPDHERFGLTSQLRPAAISVESNIAEGAGRNTDADFAHFLDMAAGSTNECECQLILANDLGYAEHSQTAPLIRQVNRVKMMLAGFIRRLRPGADSPRQSQPRRASC